MDRLWVMRWAALWLLVGGCDLVGSEQPSFRGEVRQIVDSATIPTSENGMLTEDGRFFVVGGTGLYEITGGPGAYEAVLLLEEECSFSGGVARGNTLFVACTDDAVGGTHATLQRIQPGAGGAVVVRRADFPGTGRPMLLNGMDFGPDGSLYISNTQAFLSGDPAVYRVTIASEDPLAIQVVPFLGVDILTEGVAGQGDIAPNGIRVDGDLLYLSRGLSLVRMPLSPAGSHGPISVIYRSPGLSVIDDFDIADGRIFVAEVGLLDVALGSTSSSSLVTLRSNGRLVTRKALTFRPSSAMVVGASSGDAALFMTSYFGGGLYRVASGR